MENGEDKTKKRVFSAVRSGIADFSKKTIKRVTNAAIAVRDALKSWYANRFFRLGLGVLACAGIIFAASVLALRRVPDDSLKFYAQVLKYTLVGLTTFVSIYSLTKDTVEKSTEPRQRNRFTDAGVNYLFSLILLAMLTVAASYLDDVADRRLKAAAERSGNEQFKESLKSANSELSSRLQEQVSATVDQLEFANIPLERLYVDVVVPGVSEEEMRMEGKDAGVAAQLKHDQGTTCSKVPLKEQLAGTDNDCKKAFNVGASWFTSRVLLKHFDPGDHLFLTLAFTLNAFKVDAQTVDDCDLEGTSETYRCLRAIITSTRGLTLGKASKHGEIQLGSGHLMHFNAFSFGFGLEGDQLKDLFPEGAFTVGTQA